jgi:hypothetical protein
MKFFNRYIAFYALIVLLLTLVYYYAAYRISGGNTNSSAAIWMFFIYLFLIFLSAFLIGRKDEYQAYAGFNYHLTTYLIVTGLPVIFVLLHVVLGSGPVISLCYVLVLVSQAHHKKL